MAHDVYTNTGRSQWPRGLSRGSAAAWFLGFRVRILPEAWMFCLVNVVCQVEASLSGWSLVQRSSTECICVKVSLDNEGAVDQ